MRSDILSPELKQQFESLRVLLQRALWLVEKCADAEATQILRARFTNLQSAALLVIVGEVKAGKSCFINALVNEEVCRVSPEPCTVKIQELVYGPERTVTSLGNSWERISLPKDVLRELTLVDTPGTNSIIRDHQTVTENYIPQSDLVVFVFSATNPHTNSAWEFLTVIRQEWHRKMVFVLQQADRASAHELEINRAHVKEYARARQVQNPTVFTLSAKRELEGAPDSGFAEFRNFLRYGIECGEVWRTKVEGSFQTVQTVMTKLLTRLRAEKAAVADERVFYQKLLRKVEERQERANSLKQSVVGQLTATYDRMARDSEDDFADTLRFGEIFRQAIPFAQEKADRMVPAELTRKFRDAAGGEIAREAPQIAQMLLGEMEELLEELNQQITRRQQNFHENVALPQMESRVEMLGQLKEKLTGLRVGEIGEILHDTWGEAADLRKLAIAGSGLVLLGLAIVFLFTNGWVELLGGLVVAGGIGLIVSRLFWQRVGLMRDMRRRMGTSRKEFQSRIEGHIGQIFDSLFYEVRHALAETIFRLEVQESFIAPLLEETFQVGESASEMLLRAQRMPLKPSVRMQ